MVVTTAARNRYLDVLGFRSRKAPDASNRENGSKPNRLGNEPAVMGQTVQNRPTATDLHPKPHFKWLSSDGEWERGQSSTAALAQASTNTPLTLAGSVAIENDNDLSEAWARYKRTGAQPERDELIVYYAPLVKYVASRVAAGLPQNVDQADLASYGMFGLIDAITKFDPERGFKFETYALSRIKGAVLDELRSIDWVPRSVRSKSKMLERAMTRLEIKLHRAPTDAEIAEELNMTSTQLSAIYKQIGSLGMVALDEMLSFNGSDSLTFGDTLADRRDGPGTTFERMETRQLLADAINKMNEREKIVLTLYYYENLTLAEIGRVLGVTESRVCLLYTSPSPRDATLSRMPSSA